MHRQLLQLRQKLIRKYHLIEAVPCKNGNTPPTPVPVNINWDRL